MPTLSRPRARRAPLAPDEAPTWAAELRACLGPYAEVVVSEARRELYTRDRFEPPRPWAARPALVLRPGSAHDIAAAAKWAHAHDLPITPRGLSTTAHGESLPARGGLLLDLAQFNRVGPLDVAARTIHVQAGVTWGDLEAHLEGSGLALATYPASRFSTVGGWVSTGGLGINSFGYGHLRRWVAALEVVTGEGQQRRLSPRDKVFAAFFGAEGGMGVVTGITLRLQPAPDFTRAHLFYFDSTADQLAFVQRLVESAARLAHVKLYDRRYMAYLNRLYEETHPNRPTFYEERPATLIHVDSEEQEQTLEDVLARAETLVDEGPVYAAAALWQQRFYPLALKRYGPSLLTAPAILPLAETASFIDQAMRLGERFGLAPAAETTVAENGGVYEALVMPLFPCDARRRSYPLHMLMMHLVTHTAIERGGRPYAIGAVNRLFEIEKFGPDRWRTLQAHKRVADRGGLFNPHPRVGFGAAFRRVALPMAGVFSAQIGQLARLLHRSKKPSSSPPPPRSAPLSDAELQATINACTGCGNCVPVCPAYLVTHDETTTGRAKLQTGLRLLRGEEVSQVRADSTFLCAYCKACQDVCEAELPLLAAYASIESHLAERYGRPDALIADFVAKVEASAEYRRFVDIPPAPAFAGRDKTRPPPTGDQSTTVDAVAPSRGEPVGPFNVVRSEHCINCGHCARVCPADAHSRRADDPRIMAQPVSHRCVGCLRCVQECPTRALTLTPSPTYTGLGQGVYTAAIVQRLSRQAETGRALDAIGSAGVFTGSGFEGIRLDVNQVARPPGAVQWCETAVALGRRLERLEINATGVVNAAPPPIVELAAPFVLALPPGAPDALTNALATAARRLGLLALLGWSKADSAAWIVPRVTAAELSALPAVAEKLVKLRLLVVDELERVIARLRTRYPLLALGAEVPLDRHAADAVLGLVRAGADVIFLNGHDGLHSDAQESDVLRYLPDVHEALVAVSRRERVSLIARGDIATVESAVKAMILGADAVTIDWPLLIALECRLQERCAHGAHVCGLERVDADWATQRLVNLMTAWRGQLLRLMAALGVSNVHHLRGESGRVIFGQASHLEDLGRLRRVPDPSITRVQLLGR